jgi:hypothetical protein
MINIFLISLYFHFNNMKQRGRKVIPWFQTCFLVALSGSFCILLACRLIFFHNQGKLHFSTVPIFICSLICGAVIFLFVRKYFFISNRHIEFGQKYLIDYSEKQRNRYKWYSILACILGPLMLGYFVWLDAAPIN